MIKLPGSIENLVNEITKLPSIGFKTAQRLAFYLLKQSKESRESFSKAVLEADKYSICPICFCQNIYFCRKSR